jgi:N-dimethylarginine dimethylaminohydrolase
MTSPHLIRSTSDLQGRTLKDFAERKEPENALLCPPDYFNVIDVKNPHMKDQIGRVDRAEAVKQWKGVQKAIESTDRKVHLLDATVDLEDMVFTANPVLPGENENGERIALLSNMRHPSRKKEVAAFEKWFSTHGYKAARLSNANWNFEGQGDALWHPRKKLLWGGYGFRTAPEVYEEVSRVFSTPVVLTELTNEHFYHLDTCLCPLSENEALYYPAAFKKEGIELIRALFSDPIEVNRDEAQKGFACNALVLGKTVLIQKGNSETVSQLKKRGYTPVELDTSEFMKSGGSVFCMKMMVY